MTWVNNKKEPVGGVDVPKDLPKLLKSGTKLAEALKEADLFLTSDGQLVSLAQEPPACRDYLKRNSWDRLLTNPTEDDLAIRTGMRLARNPELLLAWRDGRLLVVDLRHGRRFGAGPNLMPLLDAFSEPGTEEEGAARLPGYRRHSVLRSIRQLVRNGLLVTAA